MIKRALSILAILLTVAGAARAQSDDVVAEAKRYYEAGVQAYGAGQYPAAISAFEEAYRLSPRASVVFSLGQAYRRQYFVDHDPAKLKRAVQLYREYIDQVDKGGRRDEAVRYLADLEPLLLRVEDEQRREGKGPVQAIENVVKTQIMVTSKPTGAQVSLDGGTPLETPAVFDTEAGKHQIKVELAGWFPAEQEGVAVEGRLVVLDVPLAERPGRLAVRGPRGAKLTIDGLPAGTLPLARPVEVPAGRRFVVVSQRGRYPFARRVELERDEELELAAPLRRTTQRYVSYWFFGGAAALLLAGGVTTGVALVAASDAEAIQAKFDGGANITLDELRAHNDAVDRYDVSRQASYALFSGAVVAAATGALLYFIDNPDVEAWRQEGLAPMIGGGGGTIGVSWSERF